MRYLDFLWMIDALYKYYPRCYSNEIILMADDAWKWLNNELPDDSSAVRYLKDCFDSPTEAIRSLWNDIQLLADPYLKIN